MEQLHRDCRPLYQLKRLQGNFKHYCISIYVLTYSLSVGSSVHLEGELRESPKPGQEVELGVEKLEILGDSDPDTYPFPKKNYSDQNARRLPHLRMGASTFQIALRSRAHINSAIKEYFDKQEYMQVHAPLFTSSDCEGAGETFSITPSDFFSKDHRTNLTVSAQLHLECFLRAHPRIWASTPVFRAESSQSWKHLSEFYMVEAELAYVTDLQTLMDQVEDLIEYLTSNTTPELVELDDSALRRWELLKTRPFATITYGDAISALQNATHTFEIEPKWEDGLFAEHENYLSESILENTPVFVTHYPASQKPFYMLPSPTNTESESEERVDPKLQTVECFDLLIPELGELAGGSLREHNEALLLKAMKNKGMDIRRLQWYLDIRKWGTMPHGGYGLGLDRLLAHLSGKDNVRDVVPFPRWKDHCEC